MQDVQQEIQQVWQEADCLYTGAQVTAAIQSMSQAIHTELADECPLLLTVMNGGMMFSAALSLRLQFPVEFDYLHVTRYGAGTSGGELHWKVTPQENLQDRTVLVVDDILDEGYTLEAIVRACKAQGAKKVYTAVLVDKQHDRKASPGLTADFTGLNVEDRYVFGYGMDYKGYWRNADGIYAVKGL